MKWHLFGVLFLLETDAFMGIDGRKLEMLFVSDEKRGRGLGKTLLGYGMNAYGVNELTVNEQNPQEKGFYEHMGFQVFRRTECDEQGTCILFCT